MDSSDLAEIKHEEESRKPYCMCECHRPGSHMLHCVACCGPGTSFQPPLGMWEEPKEKPVCKCRYGGFPWDEHDADCPELKERELKKESKSENDKLLAYIKTSLPLTVLMSEKKLSAVSAIIAENEELKARNNELLVARETAISERNSIAVKMRREEKERTDVLQGKIDALTQQVADGWKHPEEQALYINRLEKNVKDLRKFAGALFTAYLEELFAYIEEDPSGERLNQLRPELAKLAERIGIKLETPT